MTELRQALDPAFPAPEDQLIACAQEVPTRKELLERLKTAPEAAWSAAVDILPDLATIAPPEVEWTAVAEWISDAPQDLAATLRTTGRDLGARLNRWWTDEN